MPRYVLIHGGLDGTEKIIYDSDKGDSASYTDAMQMAGKYRFTVGFSGGVVRLEIDGVQKNEWGAKKAKTAKKKGKSPTSSIKKVGPAATAFVKEVQAKEDKAEEEPIKRLLALGHTRGSVYSLCASTLLGRETTNEIRPADKLPLQIHDRNVSRGQLTVSVGPKGKMTVSTPFSAKNAAAILRGTHFIKLPPGNSKQLLLDDILILDIANIPKYAYFFDSTHRAIDDLLHIGTRRIQKMIPISSSENKEAVDGRTAVKPRAPQSTPTSADYLEEPQLGTLPHRNLPKPTPRRLQIDDADPTSPSEVKLNRKPATPSAHTSMNPHLQKQHLVSHAKPTQVSIPGHDLDGQSPTKKNKSQHAATHPLKKQHSPAQVTKEKLSVSQDDDKEKVSSSENFVLLEKKDTTIEHAKRPLNSRDKGRRQAHSPLLGTEQSPRQRAQEAPVNHSLSPVHPTVSGRAVHTDRGSKRQASKSVEDDNAKHGDTTINTMVDLQSSTGPGLHRGDSGKIEKIHSDGNVDDVKDAVSDSREEKKRLACSLCMSVVDTEGSPRRSALSSPKKPQVLADKENCGIKRKHEKLLSTHKKKKQKSAVASNEQNTRQLEPSTAARRSSSGRSESSNGQEPRKRKRASIVKNDDGLTSASENTAKKQWHPAVSNRIKALLKDDADHGFVAEVFMSQCVLRDEAVRPEVLDATWSALMRASDPRLIDSLTICLDQGMKTTREPWLPPEARASDQGAMVSTLLNLLALDAQESAWALSAKTAALRILIPRLNLSLLENNDHFLSTLATAAFAVCGSPSAIENQNDDDLQQALAEARLHAARLALSELISAFISVCCNASRIASILGKRLKTKAIKLADALALVKSNSLYCQAKLLQAAKHPAAARRLALATGNSTGRKSPLDTLINTINAAR